MAFNVKEWFSFRAILITFVTIFLCGFMTVAAVVLYYGNDLPRRLDLASSFRPAVVSVVHDMHGEPIAEFYLQRRIIVPCPIMNLRVSSWRGERVSVNPLACDWELCNTD